MAQDSASPSNAEWPRVQDPAMGVRRQELQAATLISCIAWLVVCPSPARLRPRAPLDPMSGNREPPAIRLPTSNSTAVGMMSVCASTAPCHRAFWKRQTRGVRAQEAEVTQRPDRWACTRTRNNAYRVPRLFDGCGRLGLCHSLRLSDRYYSVQQRSADFLVGQTRSFSEAMHERSATFDPTTEWFGPTGAHCPTCESSVSDSGQMRVTYLMTARASSRSTADGPIHHHRRWQVSAYGRQ